MHQSLSHNLRHQKSTVQDQVNKEAGFFDEILESMYNLAPPEEPGSEQSAEVQQGSPTPPKPPTKIFTKSKAPSPLHLIPKVDEEKGKNRCRAPSLVSVLFGSHWAEQKEKGMLELTHSQIPLYTRLNMYVFT